jgi:hypothetical protein
VRHNRVPHKWVRLQVGAATSGCGLQVGAATSGCELQVGAAKSRCGYKWVRLQLVGG